LKKDEVKEGTDGNYMAKQQLFIIATLAYCSILYSILRICWPLLLNIAG
jgi:hypothetical protein